ncbi:enoyl-CoA hydratase/isomerase family protein [Loktanella sp. D2R18]|uniref:enoyl-CoA hydratase/isomerase family protein n=1 Tax=Rhodobacterales TaxID=204455 RepID=UPI000DE8E5D2|nr:MULTISPECIES: enoyl-CoA hydratase/isomerase family protein [Rhodobacterales]MDO6591989.1 enoyl-CoA hydratase/isomerase family protein [Yoonia sp. 1_MG-2023]RBW46172.1 enoyl-CoA hydratase/isomerase family protein [Loktanella sp. D2R18]
MIQCEVSGDLWRVTIDRPEKAGALTRDMLVELAEIAERATVAKVVIFSGTGAVFSAGADLDQARAGLAVDPVWQRLSHAVAALPGLTIAALNGTAAGGAMGLVLACDLRIAVPTAKFFYPVMKLGYLPQASDPGRLTALVGPSRAKMILMAGQKILAEEALQWGLIDRIVPADALSAQVDQLTQNVMQADPRHVAAIKSMIPTT